MTDDLHSNQSVLVLASKPHAEKTMVIERRSYYAICFNDSEEVLLVRDNSSGLWGFPGGEREHEDVMETVRRELLEEAGVEALSIGPLIARQVQLSSGTSGEIRQQTRDFFLVQLTGYTLSPVGGTEIGQASYMQLKNISSIPLCPGVIEIANFAQKVWRGGNNRGPNV